MAFAEGFFDGLANGATIQEAFGLGRANCMVLNKPKPDMPCLHIRPGCDATSIVLARNNPKANR